MTKVCPRCNKEFLPQKHDQIYCTTNCQAYVWREKYPEKVKETEKKYREKYPEKIKIKQRVSALKRNYGITLEEYNTILISQNGKCAICQEEKDETLAVDHNHETGFVRGLLCRHCNHVVGFAKDNITILNRTISYLEKENKNEC
jgi:hypothetical protein